MHACFLLALLFATPPSPAPLLHKVTVHIAGPLAMVEVWRTVEATTRTAGDRQLGTFLDLGLPEGAALLEPLFKTGGPANFTGYSNPGVDMMLDQLSVIDPVLSKEREIKLKEIDKILYKELPVVVLFYIEKL